LLCNGDHLTQEEFHRRYSAYHEDVKFELIGGIVYTASPLKRRHGTSQPLLSYIFVHYSGATPGTEVADNMTTILGEKSEPQPDLILRLLTECGGQSSYNEEEYLVGPPELVAEVAHSSRAIDMNRKRKDYLAAGVQEYLVLLCVEEQELHWFHFPSKRTGPPCLPATPIGCLPRSRRGWPHRHTRPLSSNSHTNIPPEANVPNP
jgi:hypothetical protein